MRKTFIILLLSLIGLALNAASVKVNPPSNVVAGNTFNVVFTIIDGDNIQVKSAPQINGCRELDGPRTVNHFSSSSTINGHTTSSSRTDVAWTFLAERAGNFSISSASFLVDGKLFTTKPVSFTIADGQNISEPTTQMASGPSANDVLVRILLNKSTAYEQEAIECTIKLYTQFTITQFFPTLQPSYEGFLIDEVPIQPTINQREELNGRYYYTAVLKKCIIFPQKSGKLTINSGEYDVTLQKHDQINIDNWGTLYDPRTQKLKIKSNSASIDIKPLPEPRPEGFTGAVGDFKIDAHLVGNHFSTGESGSLIYTITGTGNIKYVKEPDIKFPSEFDTYSPKNNFDGGVHGSNVSGTLTIDYQFTPRSIGEYTIPADKFVYFNPADGQYHTLSTQPFTINVEQGKNVDDVNTSHLTDIITIIENVDAQKASTPIVEKAWYWIVYILLFGALIGALYYYNRLRALNADVTGRKMARAEKVARGRLEKAQQQLAQGKTELFYAEILEAMQGYIADKLLMGASLLSRDNIASELNRRGVAESTVNQVIDIIDSCEMARYTPGASSSSQQTQLLQQSQDVISQLEASLKK